MFTKLTKTKTITYVLLIGFIFQITIYNSTILSQEKKIKGKIVGLGPNKAWIDVGSQNGVNVGMQFQVKRKGEVIGIITVRKVFQASSEAEITSVAEGKEIDLQDKVENITKEEAVKEEKKVEIKEEPQIVEIPKEEKKEITQVSKEEIIQPPKEEKPKEEIPRQVEVKPKEVEVKEEKVIKQEEKIVQEKPHKPEEKKVAEKPEKLRLMEEKHKEILEKAKKDKDISKKLSEMQKKEETTKKPKKKLTTYLLGGIIVAAGIVALSGSKKDKEDAKAKTGSIDISSFPSGADVYLNSEFKGKTNPNLIITNVPVGTHKIKLSKQNFIDVEVEIVVYENKTTRKDIFLIVDPQGNIPNDPFKK